MKKYALIPAYEPDERLLSLCAELTKEGYETVVVDDGSGEAFKKVFSQLGQETKLLTHPVNRGKGGAVKTGLQYISEMGSKGDVIVTADADGQHRIGDINNVTAAAAHEPGVLVLGSRTFSGDIPLRSKLGNTITRGIFRCVAHQKVTDTQTGLRAFTYEMISFMLDIQGDRYEYEMNVLLQCAPNNISIAEVPIETVYIDGNSSSHFRPFRDACRIYKEIFRFSASSFLAFLIDYALFSLFSKLPFGAEASVPVANVLARIISATANFCINRKYVFRDKGSWRSSVLRYAALAIGILVGNTLLLTLLTSVLGMNRYLAKLLTEIFFFLLSWQVQKRFVFKKHA